MNINPEFNSEERPNIKDTMTEAMGYLYKKFIKPKEAELGRDDLDHIALIGVIFKDIAEKAEAYYEMQEKGYKKNPHSLN